VDTAARGPVYVAGMNAAGRRRALLVDAVIAGALLLEGLGELSGVIPGTQFPGADGWHAVFVVLTALPLVVRRVWPLTTMVTVVTVVAIWQYSLYGPDQQPPFEPFVALLLVVFTAGVATSGRAARAAVAVMVVGFSLTVVDLVAGQPLGAAVPPLLQIIGVFVLGRLFAGYRSRAVAEGARAARLEQESELARAEAVREERARIARELHDVVSHDVNLMVLQATVERRVSGVDGAPERDAVLASIEATGREALAELRRMLGVLRHDDAGPPLAPQPGLGEVDQLVAQAREAGVDVELVTEGDRSTLTPGIDLTAYRILQESLTNVAKHAADARTVATIRHGRDWLEIEVVDDGASARGSGTDGAGLGLVGMRERVSVYGGSLVAGRRLDAPGFRVLARIPLEVG
jgi:signal transduction histidine kinase